MNDHLDNLFSKLFIGAGAPLTGLAISHTTVNLWLQTISLCIGIFIAVIVPLIGLIKKKIKK